VRSTAAPYTESRLTRSVANERVGFPVVEQLVFFDFADTKSYIVYDKTFQAKFLRLVSF
jgi:hypothetical protein